MRQYAITSAYYCYIKILYIIFTKDTLAVNYKIFDDDSKINQEMLVNIQKRIPL